MLRDRQRKGELHSGALLTGAIGCREPLGSLASAPRRLEQLGVASAL